MNPEQLSLYLKKMGLDARVKPRNFANLTILNRTHMTTFTYANHRLRKQTITGDVKNDLSVDVLFKKIVRDGKAMHCFYLTELFAQALSALGYDIERHRSLGTLCDLVDDPEAVAKVMARYDGLPDSHVVLTVKLEGQTYLLDPHFSAAGPLEPVPFVLDQEFTQSNGEKFRLRAAEAGRVFLEAQLNSEASKKPWRRFHKIELAAATPQQIAETLDDLALCRSGKKIAIREWILMYAHIRSDAATLMRRTMRLDLRPAGQCEFSGLGLFTEQNTQTHEVKTTVVENWGQAYAIAESTFGRKIPKRVLLHYSPGFFTAEGTNERELAQVKSLVIKNH